MKSNSNDSGGLGFIVFLLAFVCIIAYYVWFLIVPIILGYYACKLIDKTKSTTNQSINSTIARTSLKLLENVNHIRTKANAIRLDCEEAYFKYGEETIYYVNENLTDRPQMDLEYVYTLKTQEARDEYFEKLDAEKAEFEMKRQLRILKHNNDLDVFYREIKY